MTPRTVLLKGQDIRVEFFDVHRERYFDIITPYDHRLIHETVFLRKLKEMLNDDNS
jgi:hypothetical protein